MHLRKGTLKGSEEPVCHSHSDALGPSEGPRGLSEPHHTVWSRAREAGALGNSALQF